MSLRTIADFCSHIQNASAARLALTSVKSTKSTLALAQAMHRQGFLSHVYRAGTQPPTEEEMLTVPMAPLTPDNIGNRRLWIGLKYFAGRPVLNACESISTSRRRVNVRLPELQRLANGMHATLDKIVLRGLEPGECLFLFTSEGYLEAREAMKKRLGGKVLARVS